MKQVYAVPFLFQGKMEQRMVLAGSASEAASILLRGYREAIVMGYPTPRPAGARYVAPAPKTMAESMEQVLMACQQLGFRSISPESLTELGEMIERGFYREVRGDYRAVMAGFRALLAPV